jgi:hypothetical protein
VTRTIENLSDYLDHTSFRRGSVHKLITIGTPHRGSPLAQLFIQSANTCARDRLAGFGNVSVYQATVEGRPVMGANCHLQGDANGANLSVALQRLQASNGHEVPTALISAITDSRNTDSLIQLRLSVDGVGHKWIGTRCNVNPIAQSLTPTGWRAIFGQDNDGAVSESSQTNGGMGAGAPAVGYVHSKGFVGVLGLGFTEPYELLANMDNPIPAKVVELLNAPSWNPTDPNSKFHWLP